MESTVIGGGGGCRLLPFLVICQKLKILWHFENFVNTGPYGAGNFKALLLLQFASNFNQTLWGHWLPWENTGCYFLGNWPILNKFVTLWNFNMGVNRNIMKCAISWKWLTVERNDENLRLVVLGTRVLFGSGHLSSIWGHSVHFAKFPMLRFSKGYCCPSFHPISTKTLLNAW